MAFAEAASNKASTICATHSSEQVVMEKFSYDDDIVRKFT